MPADDPELPAAAPHPSAERWNERVAGSATHALATLIPPLADPSRARSTAWARDVLPPVGGTVLDVGCGAGAGSLALVPPATEIIGVDPRGVLLDDFVAAASARGVARRTVHGHWPDAVTTTPVADVVLCQHVVQSVTDIVPFVLTLTDRARLAVVAELPAEHPSAAMRALGESLGVAIGDRPVVAADLVAVLAELGLAPETRTDERLVAGVDELTAFVESIRTGFGLEGDDLQADDLEGDDLEALVAEHVAGTAFEVLTFRWPGAADPAV